MSRPLIWGVALAMAAVSCTGGSTSDPSVETSTNMPTPTDPGKLAIVDGDGEIVVVDPDGSDPLAVTETDDGSALYTQPIWSPDATTLAWGQATESGFGLGFSQPESGEITALSTPNLPFYTYWSPNSRHLGILHNGTTGVQFQIVDIDEKTVSALDEDAPFYFSWSPEGDRMVIHAGADRVETLWPDGEREESEPTADTYLAPQWTATGIFHVVDDRVVIEDDAGTRKPLVVVSGLTMFVANPQGTTLALQTTSGEPGPITASTEDLPSVGENSVAVLDVASGRTVTPSDRPAIGFFWSPDGGKLLILTVEDERVVPMVWTEDDTMSFPGFSPAPQMVRDTFPFFPQYAQSVNFWSPGSSAFAFAGAVGEDAGIWVQELDADAPRHVSDGTWVAWTPRS